MKTTKKSWIYLAASLAAIIGMQSCTKDTEILSDTDIVLAQDEEYADALYDEIDNLVITETYTLDENGYVTSSLKSADEDVCYSVTVDHPDSTNFPKVITIDFGDGCTIVVNGDTITRSGQILITLTDRCFVAGAQRIVTFNNFYYNGTRIEGTRTITNLGLNEQNRREMRIMLQDGKLTFGDGKWMTRNANHVRAWAHYPDAVLMDSLFITGSAYGINVLGESYEREIIEPIVKIRCAAYRWRWITISGTIQITNSARGTTTISHKGSGCETDVEVNKNGDNYYYRFRYNNRNNRDN